MKIVVDNSGYELKNFGDVSMLITAVERIEQLNPNADIYVFTNAPQILNEICPSVIPVELTGRLLWISQWYLFGGVSKLIPKKFHETLRVYEMALKNRFPEICARIILLRMQRRGIPTERMTDYLNLIKTADVVVASGGGFITDAFASHAYRLLTTLDLAQNLNIPSVMFGQGVGPVSDKSLLKIAKKVLSELHYLGLRESVYSPSCVKDFGVKDEKVCITGDDAIEMANLKGAGSNKASKIGVNIRVSSYSNLGNKELVAYKAALDDISTKLNVEFVPIPISMHDEDSDLNSIKQLLGPISKEVSYNSAEDVLAAVSQCRLIITGSYHAGVYALSKGIPVIALYSNAYYKQKFEGLQKQFGEGCILLNTSETGFKYDIVSTVSELWENADQYKEALLISAELQIASSKRLFKVAFSNI